MNRWIASVLCALVLPGCFVYTRPEPVTVSGGASVQTSAVATGAQCTCIQGAQEVCNGCDDNCNGSVDEGCSGGGGVVTSTVATPSGGVVVNNPPPPRQCTCVQGAQEVCGNGCDDNCNGSVDEGC